MKVICSGMTYELGANGLLRWGGLPNKSIGAFHLAAVRGENSIEVYVPTDPQPRDVEDGARLVCPGCGK